MSEPKQGILRTPDGATIATLTLGRGPRRLVYLPGAGDGLATPLDAPGRLAMWLRGRGSHFRVLYISRRDPLPAGFSLADQAADVIWTMERLGWDGSLIEAQSAGGPVGQLVAAMRPDLAPVLVLASSAGWLDAQAQLACEGWLDLARRGDWGAFMTQATELLWCDANMALLRPFRRLLSELAAPRDPLRVVHLLESLLTLDHRALLRRRVGDIVEVVLPGGRRSYRLLTIAYAEASAPTITDRAASIAPSVKSR